MDNRSSNTLLISAKNIFGNTGTVKLGKGDLMREQFDMSNSRRGSSPPFQEYMEVPSQISSLGQIVPDAIKNSKSSKAPQKMGKAVDGVAPASVR
jgi:hypothetical protein